MSKKLKIKFAPGCFDNFEGSQEELDQIVKDLENGDFLNNSKPIDLEALELEDPDLFKILSEQLSNLNDQSTSKRKLN